MILGVGLLVVGGRSVSAQTSDGGPIVISPQRDWELIRFYDLDLALELEWRRQVDELDPQGGATQRDTQDRLREILDLRTGGYIGHPNLLELDLGGQLWFEQQWLDFSNTISTDRVDQVLFNWDVSGLFLRESAVPFTLYTRQNTSDIDVQFGGSLENTFREYGARANIRAQGAPTNVQIFRRDIKQKDFSLGEQFRIDQYTVQADGRVDVDLNQRLAWDAKYDIVDESGQLRTPISFNRFEANATHAFEFGTDQQNLLRTRLRLFDESGDRALRQVSLDPRLRLRHSQTLNSWYDYSFEWNDRPEQEQFTNRATANFQYQVFDSLTMIGNAGFNLFDIPTENFTSNELFSRLDVQYIKEIPLGQLAAGVNGVVSRVDQSEQGTPIQVTDDQAAFNMGFLVINVRNVVTSSIVITDQSGIIVFTENTDYVVLGFPDRVEIRLIPGSMIGQNQVVLLDYVIGPEPGGVTDTLGLGVDLRYTFQEGPLRGLGFYGQYFHQDESRSILTEDFPENDFTDLIYGVEYNYSNLYLRAERQHRDSTLSPFDATRLEGRYLQPLGLGSNLVVGALFQEIDRSQDNIRTTTATFSGQWNQRISDQLRMSLLLQYQLSDDNVTFDSDGFEGQLDVSWRYRQTEIYAQLRASITDSTADDTSFQRFIVGIRREF